MKTALITGANKGIGFETARYLLQQGYFVYLGSRDEARGAAAVSSLHEQGLANCAAITIDVCSQPSVEGAAALLAEKGVILDVLINNAGILGTFPPPESSESIVNAQQVFDTNYFGVLRVTTALLPLMQASPQPRIVNISSEMASLQLHQDPAWQYYPIKDKAYVPSKTALNFYTISLAYQLRDSAFKVNSVCPGYTATSMNNFTAPGKAGDAARTIAAYAMLEETGPTGKFFNAAGEIPW
jgi:NAD(P)-dependent dehydrogenase (short-subunit alcohol dehydrogenase family)